MKKWYNNKGYVILMSVLVVGAVSLAIATTLLLLGLSSSQTSFAEQQSYQAKALASACAEEGLEKIRESILFAGSGNLNIGAGSCGYSVAITGLLSRTITASGTVGSIVRKVSININQILPLIQVVSWQEVAS